MKRAHAFSISPLLAAVVLWASCSAEDPTSDSTNSVTPGAGGSAAGAGATGGATAGVGGPAGAGGIAAGATAGGGTQGGTLSGGTSGTGTTGAGTGMPGGSPAGGNIATVTVDNKPCEKVVRTAAKTIPDFMIVLDRSQSMKPDCTSNDIFASFECGRQNVNCSQAPHMGTTICGGTVLSTLDRWTPAVGAIKSLTQMFQARVNFGLTVFPGPQEGRGQAAECSTGTQRVPLGLNTAMAIAGELDMTKPTGRTPTGPTLEVVAQQIDAKKNSPDTQLQPQYVLLVTDGAPTCPGANTMNNPEAHQATIAAIDKLAKLGVKTYVIGYDASVDPMLAMQLTEYAQHGGTNNFFAVQDGPSLVAQFTSITTVAVECTYTLDKMPADPKYVLVELDGKKLNLGEPDGWSINERNVTIEGASCAALRDSTRMHTLAVTVECKIQEID